MYKMTFKLHNLKLHNLNNCITFKLQILFFSCEK